MLWLTLALSFMLLALKLFSYSPRLVEQLYSNTLSPPSGHPADPAQRPNTLQFL